MSFDDDYRILTGKNGIPEEIDLLINKTGRLLVPANQEEQPGPHFLRYHRETIFKG